MKKTAFILFLAMALAFLFSPGAVQCQPGDTGYGGGPGYGYRMGPGMMGGGYGPQGGGWQCPYCGSHMGGWYGPRQQQSQKPLTDKEAESIAKTYIQRNPNLKIGAVKDVGNAFEAEIRTRNNELIDKILVDKYSGWIRSAY